MSLDIVLANICFASSYLELSLSSLEAGNSFKPEFPYHFNSIYALGRRRDDPDHLHKSTVFSQNSFSLIINMSFLSVNYGISYTYIEGLSIQNFNDLYTQSL